MNVLKFIAHPGAVFKPLVFGTVGANSPRFLRWSYPLLLAALLLLVWIAGAQAAEDFLAPANEGLTSLRTQIVGIAGAIFGVGIVAYGVWSAMIQRILWEKLWVFVIAALLVTVGPAGISYMFDTFGA